MKFNFITGATGCLGRLFIKELLAATDDHLYLLVRRKNRQTHWDRIRKLLMPWGLEYLLGTRVHVLEGDVTIPGLGLSTEDRELLRKRVTHFYHIAALTSLNGSAEECRRINIEGTDEALKLAQDLQENGGLKRFFYFSTAYVAGSRQTYVALEDELPKKPAHANFYESSKYTAESHVRQSMAQGLPVTIFRPSIVVGDSKTGEVSEFNVIYPFMKLFAHGILSILPTHLDNSVNIVPIDFVIRASCAIASQDSSVGKTYHLVTKEPPTIGTLLQLKEEIYPDAPDIEVIAPSQFESASLDPMSKTVFDMLEPYLGYLNDALSFDTRNTECALAGTGISFPKTDYEFLKVIVHYAVQEGYLVLPTAKASVTV